MNRASTLFILGVFAAGLAAPASAAQEIATTSKRAERQADERTEHLTKALQLNPEQEQKVRDIERESERRKMEIQGETDTNIRAALTPEQQSRFDKMKS